MLGSGLKKMAKEAGLKTDRGIAYGDYMGYAVTLWEGAGYKAFGVSARCTEESKILEFQEQFSNEELDKRYRITDITVGTEGICVIFHDNPGTMKRYREFVQWFLPQISQYGFLGSAYCPMCGLLLDNASSWKLDLFAVHGHDRCFAARENEEKAAVEKIKDEDTGNYASGFLGAALGAVLGSVPWAIVMSVGYVTAILGFVISLLAGKGYDLFHGKKGKGKIPIVAFMSIAGVLLGNVLSDVLSIGIMIGKGELFGASFSDIPMLMEGLFQNPEYVDTFLRNLGLGIFFALLGMSEIIWKMYKQDPTKISSSKALK